LQTVGIVLILSGAFLIYSVLHSRSQSGSSSSSTGGGSGGGGEQHQGIDLTGMATGVVGSIYTIFSSYGSMSDQQKDDANAYARQIGNVSA
jgi:hypothetical protein